MNENGWKGWKSIYAPLGFMERSVLWYGAKGLGMNGLGTYRDMNAARR